MPWAVTLAAALQLLTAVTFAAIGYLAYKHGDEAQAAAEAEVVKQGHPLDLLERGRVNFRERGLEAVLPFLIAVALALLAVLNMAGSGLGRLSTWVVHSVLLVAGGFITAAQVFVVPFIESSFRKSGDAQLAGVDVRAWMDAATQAFPSWFRIMVVVRFALVTVGSIVVIVLLALPRT